MTPQSTFMVVAPIADGKRAELEALLASMTSVACLADPANGLVPFERFDRLHFARFVILDPQTLGDYRRLWRNAGAVGAGADVPG